MVNLDLYRVFYTVAKSGSLTKAAEQLFISQPAVSQSIKQLESQLGVRLFNRTYRGMELTPEGGRIVYQKVEQALKLFSEAETEIEQLNSNATGTIRIAASQSVFEYLLADHLVQFHSKYPAVKFELTTGKSARVIEDLKAKRCDVAFVNLPAGDDANLVVSGKVLRLTDVFVVGEKYKELANGVVPIEKLKEYPLILPETGTSARRLLSTFLDGIGVNLTSDMEIGGWDLMKRLVIRGMGVGVIPREYASHRLADHTMYEIKTDPTLPVRSVGPVLLRDSKISYALRVFLDSFLED